jgi:hypothetical protein
MSPYHLPTEDEALTELVHAFASRRLLLVPRDAGRAEIHASENPPNLTEAEAGRIETLKTHGWYEPASTDPGFTLLPPG